MIAKRLSNLLRANVSQLITHLESPEKIIQQSLLDMQESLSGLRRRYITASAGCKRMEGNLADLISRAGRSAERARALIQAGDEPAGRRELAREIYAHRLIERYQAQAAKQAELIAGLKHSLDDLEAKVEEARRRRDELKAREAAATARREIGSAFAGVSKMQSSVDIQSFTTFARMEDRVLTLEAESEALAQLQANMTALGTLGDVVAPSDNSLIEKKLEQIKNEFPTTKEI